MRQELRFAGGRPIPDTMTVSAARDRVHVDVAGRTLTDSDLGLLAKALGRVITWPTLRGAPPAEALHMAAIRTSRFGGRPGGDMVTAMQRYDAARREQGRTEAFGAHFIAACRLGRTRAIQEERRRERPATEEPLVGTDVLRMWLAG